MHSPTVVFGAGWAEDRSVLEKDWLVLYRSEKMAHGRILAEFAWIAPSPSVVAP